MARIIGLLKILCGAAALVLPMLLAPGALFAAAACDKCYSSCHAGYDIYPNGNGPGCNDCVEHCDDEAVACNTLSGADLSPGESFTHGWAWKTCNGDGTYSLNKNNCCKEEVPRLCLAAGLSYTHGAQKCSCDDPLNPSNSQPANAGAYGALTPFAGNKCVWDYKNCCDSASIKLCTDLGSAVIGGNWVLASAIYSNGMAKADCKNQSVLEVDTPPMHTWDTQYCCENPYKICPETGIDYNQASRDKCGNHYDACDPDAPGVFPNNPLSMKDSAGTLSLPFFVVAPANKYPSFPYTN